ncbi:MAG TPA: hypothetical protein VIQ05_15325 [Tardiphaga sp.]
MAEKSSDPAELWRAMLGEMEKGFNAFATQAMASPEFSKAVHQVGGVSAGAQKQLSELMEKYLAGMNLPSRSQMTQFGERLQAIESQLAEITLLLQARPVSGAPDVPPAPKPPRTRRPPAAGEVKPGERK